MAKYKSIGGLNESELESIRKLKAQLQHDTVSETVSLKDAVMLAVNNELERRNDSR